MKISNTISWHKKLLMLPTTLLSYGLGGLIILFLFVPCFVLVAIPETYRPQKLFFWFLDKMYKSIPKAMFIPVHIEQQQTAGFTGATGTAATPEATGTTSERGTKRETEADKLAIFVANHESALDIPLLGIVMNKHPHFWYVWDYYMKLPFFGFFARRIGVPVNQDSPAKSSRSLVEGLQILGRKNISAIIFPEGGRFVDGTIHPFFQGFALMAKKTKRPIIPVFLHNTGKIYQPHSFFIYHYPALVRVGPGFYYNPDETLDDFSKRVHDWFVQQKTRAS